MENRRGVRDASGLEMTSALPKSVHDLRSQTLVETAKEQGLKTTTFYVKET